MSYTTEHQRIAQHEASHVVVAWLLGFRVRLVRMGAVSGGLVDVLPDYDLRPAYRDPALAPFPLFMGADPACFSGGGYSGPLPAALPANGARVVADLMAILLAGYAIEAEDAASAKFDYDTARVGACTDASQVEILVRRYPEMAMAKDALLRWMPGFMRDYVVDEVEAVAQVLLNPSREAQASWIGTEDLAQLRDGFTGARYERAANKLNAELEGLVFLVERSKAASRAA